MELCHYHRRSGESQHQSQTETSSRNTELFPSETKAIWTLPYVDQGTRPSAEHAGDASSDGFIFHPRKAGEKMRAKKNRGLVVRIPASQRERPEHFISIT